MATRNLEKDKARFAEWRRQKQGREPIPEELWQKLANLTILVDRLIERDLGRT